MLHPKLQWLQDFEKLSLALNGDITVIESYHLNDRIKIFQYDVKQPDIDQVGMTFDVLFLMPEGPDYSTAESLRDGFCMVVQYLSCDKAQMPSVSEYWAATMKIDVGVKHFTYLFGESDIAARYLDKLPTVGNDYVSSVVYVTSMTSFLVPPVTLTVSGDVNSLNENMHTAINELLTKYCEFYLETNIFPKPLN